MALAMRGFFETEVKLVATPAMLRDLRAHADLVGPESTSQLVNTYFDTSEGGIAAAGATLRIRGWTGGREQTLKLAAARGPAVRRSEWTVAIAGDAPDPSLFPATARTAVNRLLGGAGLRAVATSRIERTVRRVRYRKSEVEIAFDSGTIETGGRVGDVCEIELELLRGNLADLLGLAARLPLGPDLYWSLMSKAARCHALASDSPALPVHARPIVFPRGATTGMGFQAIAGECLGQLLGNYRLVVGAADPEAVHQTRVAIRRLRAACSLFGDVIDDEDAPAFRAELKAVATGLSELRDLDVLTQRVHTAAIARGQDASALLQQFARRRDEIAQPVRTMLAGEAFQKLLFGLAIWIEAGLWCVQYKDTAALLVRTFAARELARRTRKLLRRSRNLPDMPIEERHALRIAIKKLRYATEFFASLFPDGDAGKRRRRTAKALSSLQESLGELNDLAVAFTTTGALFADVDPIGAAALEVQLAGLLKGGKKQARGLLKLSEKSLARLGDLPAWWKADRTEKP